MQLGNGRWESKQFNSRLQPTQIGLGRTENATDLLDLDYSYGTTQNNGNVLSQTITVPTVGASTGFTAVQNYSYDPLNRLKDATENITPHGGSQTQSWKQTYQFDRYGNRRFDFTSGATTTPESSCPGAVCNPGVDPSNNRINATGYSFDTAGNTTRDAQDRKFTYDAENKQVKVESLSPGTQSVTGTIGEYVYDGDGRRVKKVVPATGESTIFVYDANAKLIAEYSNQVASQPDAKIAYLTADSLGSPRLNTGINGNVTARHDYHPFGEEITTTERALALHYASDAVRKQFTGYERDPETDLDFAQARYLGSSLGRFMTVDPIMQVSPMNPQTLNKYVYAINSPYRFVDRNGEWPTEIHNLIFLLSLPGLSEDEMRRMQDGSYSVDMPRTVLGYYANQHGMCKPSQGAFECAIGVITAPMPDANKIGEVSDSLSKHWYFGRYSHTGQDIVSPAHGFEIYDDRNFIACASSLGTNLVACALYAKEALDHAEQEKVITQARLNELIQWQRKAYGTLFGNEALSRGLGIFANARFEFSGPIDGRTLPTVVIDDLGVVIVYSDGREQYEGPWKRRRRRNE